MTGICDGCGQPHAVLAIVGDPHTAGVALCPQCRIPPADSVRPGVPMTDHAQREALIAQLEWQRDAKRNRTLAGPGVILTAEDCGLLLAALRASAPPAPEGDTLRAALQDIMQTLGPNAPSSPECCEGCSTEIGIALQVLRSVGIEYRSRKRAAPAPHTARTAIAEPPTGMREVPGTPGLYEVAEAQAACADCGHPKVDHNTDGLGECYHLMEGGGLCQCPKWKAAHPPLALDALAREILLGGHAATPGAGHSILCAARPSGDVCFCGFAERLSEVTAIIRTVLDRVKEAK